MLDLAWVWAKYMMVQSVDVILTPLLQEDLQKQCAAVGLSRHKNKDQLVRSLLDTMDLGVSSALMAGWHQNRLDNALFPVPSALCSLPWTAA